MFEPPANYPYEGHFTELTDDAKVVRLTIADALLTAMEAFVADDGNLNPWEQEFLASIYNLVRRTDGRAWLSAKVWAKMNEIANARWDATSLYKRIVNRMGDPALMSWQQDLLELVYGKYRRSN